MTVTLAGKQLQALMGNPPSMPFLALVHTCSQPFLSGGLRNTSLHLLSLLRANACPPPHENSSHLLGEWLKNGILDAEVVVAVGMQDC